MSGMLTSKVDSRHLESSGSGVTMRCAHHLPGQAARRRGQRDRGVGPSWVRGGNHPALRPSRITVSPGQSRNRPLGERDASSARTSASKRARWSPNRWGAANEVEK